MERTLYLTGVCEFDRYLLFNLIINYGTNLLFDLNVYIYASFMIVQITVEKFTLLKQELTLKYSYVLHIQVLL